MEAETNRRVCQDMSGAMTKREIEADPYQKQVEAHSHVDGDEFELKDGTVVEEGGRYGLRSPGDHTMVDFDDDRGFEVEVYALTWVPHDTSYTGDPICHLEIHHKLVDVPEGYEHLMPRDDKTSAWNFEGARVIDDDE